MRAFHRCFLPSFSSFGWRILKAYLSVIQFIANCILPISIFKLQLSPFPQKNRFFLKHTIINMNCLWRPGLLMDRWVMRAFHRCFLPSFSSFGWGVLEAYLSVIQFIANCILLISIFKLELSPFPQKNNKFKHTIINMNFLWRPCVPMDPDEMSNLYRGPSIDASYQLSVHLAQWFQRRRF